MKNRPAPRLDIRRTPLIAAAALIAVVLPIGFAPANGRPGRANEPQSTAVAQTGGALANNAKFEVASIRQIDRSGNSRLVMRIIDRPDDGRFYATAATAKILVEVAYGVRNDQIEDGPKWINSERFDVQAKADETLSDQLKALSPAEAKLVKQHMVQSLLADRFRLSIHHKTRELPVYDLVIAKNGPKLQEASKAGRVQPAKGEAYATFYNGSASGVAEFLTHELGRKVVDKTGITQKYTFTLYYAPERGHGMMAGMPEPVDATQASAAAASSGPSIFTALQQQLGLRLKPSKGPVRVLVIDHIDRPTPN